MQWGGGFPAKHVAKRLRLRKHSSTCTEKIEFHFETVFEIMNDAGRLGIMCRRVIN